MLSGCMYVYAPETRPYAKHFMCILLEIFSTILGGRLDDIIFPILSLRLKEVTQFRPRFA